jgi:HEAT repeat protein
VRAAAAKAIGLMAPASGAALPALMTLLKDKDRKVKLSAIAALGLHRGAAFAALPTLQSLSKDDDADLRSAAVNARRLIETR